MHMPSSSLRTFILPLLCFIHSLVLFFHANLVSRPLPRPLGLITVHIFVHDQLTGVPAFRKLRFACLVPFGLFRFF